jgi:hypothetical protein
MKLHAELEPMVAGTFLALMTQLSGNSADSFHEAAFRVGTNSSRNLSGIDDAIVRPMRH